MDIYDILSEAKNGDIEKATKQFIKFISDQINEEGLDIAEIVKKALTNGELYTDEELKRIAVVEFISNFISNHKTEIESNYNLLPLTNDKELIDDISNMRKKEVDTVTKEAVKRSNVVVDSEIKEQVASFYDKKFDGYLENEQDDPEYLSVLKALDQNRDGLKQGVFNSVVDDEKETVGQFMSDSFDKDEYKGYLTEKVSKVKLSIEDVQSQLESNPIWQKISRRVPSDEIYELIGNTLSQKDSFTR